LIAAGLIAADAGRRGSWRVRGMATEESARRRGAGTAVLAALLDHARGHGARSVWGNIRTPARSLYERAGFRTVSDEFELPGIGPHFRMELTLAHSGGDDPPRGAERRGRGGAGNRGAARARASRSGGGDVRRRPS
jgi:GNAT superfamily N-acetyltransferase